MKLGVRNLIYHEWMRFLLTETSDLEVYLPTSCTVTYYCNWKKSVSEALWVEEIELLPTHCALMRKLSTNILPFKCINLLEREGDREREGKTERELLCLLIHYPNGSHSQAGLG